LLTGQAGYLEPYRQSLSEISGALNELRAAAETRPDQILRIKAIEPLIDTKLAELQRSIEVRQSRGFEAALAVVTAGQGKEAMERIRNLCAEIERVANERRSGDR